MRGREGGREKEGRWGGKVSGGGSIVAKFAGKI